MGIHIIANHVFREANMAVDWLSKFGHSITNSFSLDLCFSPALRALMVDDIAGCTLARRGV